MWRRSLVPRRAYKRGVEDSEISLRRALGGFRYGSSRHVHSTCSRQVDVHALIAQKLKEYNVLKPEQRYTRFEGNMDDTRPRPPQYARVEPTAVLDRGDAWSESAQAETTADTPYSVKDIEAHASDSARADETADLAAPAPRSNRFAAAGGPKEAIASVSRDNSAPRAPRRFQGPTFSDPFQDAFANVRRDDGRHKPVGGLYHGPMNVRQDDHTPRTPSRTPGERAAGSFEADLASVRRDDYSPARNSTQFQYSSSISSPPSSLRPSQGTLAEPPAQEAFIEEAAIAAVTTGHDAASLGGDTEQDVSPATSEQSLDEETHSSEPALPNPFSWEKGQNQFFMTDERPPPTWSIINSAKSVTQMVELLYAGRLRDRPSLYFHFRGNKPMGMLIYALHRNEIFAIDTNKLGYAAFNPITAQAFDSKSPTFKDLLESQDIRKVFYDVRTVKLNLWEEYQVDLQGVDDLQLMDAASRPKPNFQELDRCITDYLITRGTDHHNPHFWYRALNRVPAALAEHGIKKGGFEKLQIPDIRVVWQYRLQGMSRLHEHYSATPGLWMDRAKKETAYRLDLQTIKNTPKIRMRKNCRLTKTPALWYDVWQSKDSPLKREKNRSELGAAGRAPSESDVIEEARKEAAEQALTSLYRTTLAIRTPKLRRFNLQALEQVIEHTGHSKLHIRTRAGGNVPLEGSPEEVLPEMAPTGRESTEEVLADEPPAEPLGREES